MIQQSGAMVPAHVPYDVDVQESVLPQGTTDDQLIGMWLHGKAMSTQAEYSRDIALFQQFVGLPLRAVKLPHMQAYADELAVLGIAAATLARRLKSVKSLLSFAQKTGYTRFNVGTMVSIPKYKQQLALRILSEEQVLTMIIQEPPGRNRLLLRILYASGVRVSELCDLCWGDVTPHGESGQITVFGKGAKTRSILLKPETYLALAASRGTSPEDSPVFRSRGGGHGRAGHKLDPSQVWRIVECAAVRAGINLYQEVTTRPDGQIETHTRSRVSPHWLRHAHASHAIDHGASLELVRQTFGHEGIETTAGYTHARPGTSSAQYLQV